MLMSAAAMALAIQSAPDQEPRPPVYTNAEACLRQNVDAAVAASSGAADAAEFLISYLCAEPIGAVTRYEANTALVKQMNATRDAMMNLADSVDVEVVDPVTDDSGEGADVDEAASVEGFDFGSMFGEMNVDPVTGDLVATSPGMLSALSGAQNIPALLNNEPPASLRALVGQLIVERRR